MRFEIVKKIHPEIASVDATGVYYTNGDNGEKVKFTNFNYVAIELEEAKIKKKNLIQELEDYYNSDSFRMVKIGNYTIPNRAWVRSLADEGIVAYNDKVNSGQIQRDEELPIKWKLGSIKIPLTYSFLCTVSEDLTRMINILYIKKEDLIDELNKSTDEDYISSWLESSKQALDELKASL